MKIFPSSTAGIIIMLVNITISHCIKVRCVRENKAASGVMKYMARIKHNKNKKLKLKNLFKISLLMNDNPILL